MEQSKTAVAYIRVSTQSQADDGYGLDAQRADIEKYALANGYIITNWLEDAGYSGASIERPALHDLLYSESVSDKCGIDTVLIAKTDRLSRDVNLYYYILYVLKTRGVEVISINTAEDFSALGALAPVMQALISAFAAFERQRITERTAAGRIAKAKLGGHAGGKLAYGYRIKAGEIVPYWTEAKIVRHIFRLRREGHSWGEIAKTVNMSRATVVTMHHNPIYKGWITYGGVVAHRPDLCVVDPEDSTYVPESQPAV